MLLVALFAALLTAVAFYVMFFQGPSVGLISFEPSPVSGAPAVRRDRLPEIAGEEGLRGALTSWPSGDAEHGVVVLRVRDAKGEALAEVDCVLLRPNLRGEMSVESASVASDREGMARFRGPWRPGLAEVVLTHPDHAQARHLFRLPFPGLVRDLGAFRLAAGVVVGGRVSVDGGGALAGAEVEWEVRDPTTRGPSIGRGSAMTDGEGKFDLGRLPMGELALHVEAERIPPIEAHRGHVGRQDREKWIEVSVVEPAPVRVRVRSSGNLALKDVEFRLLYAGRPGQGSARLPAARNGDVWHVFWPPARSRTEVVSVVVAASEHRFGYLNPTPSEFADALAGRELGVTLDPGSSHLVCAVVGSEAPGEWLVGVIGPRAKALPRLTRLTAGADGRIRIPNREWQPRREDRVVVVRPDFTVFGRSRHLSNRQLLDPATVVEVHSRSTDSAEIVCEERSTSRPVPGARIRVLQVPSAASPSRRPDLGGVMTTRSGAVPKGTVLMTCVTDSAGRARLPVLPGIRFALRIDSPAHASVDVHDLSPEPGATTRVLLSSEAVLLVRAADRGVRDARVMAVGPDRRILLPDGRTEGGLEFQGLAAGDYLVGTESDLRWARQLGEKGQRALAATSTVSLVALSPGVTTTVDLPVARYGGFGGRISSSVGEADGWSVDVLPEGFDVPVLIGESRAVTASGRYESGLLPPGSYSVRLFTRHSFRRPVAIRRVEVVEGTFSTVDWVADWARLRVTADGDAVRLYVGLSTTRGTQLLRQRIEPAADLLIDLSPGTYGISLIGAREPFGRSNTVLHRRELDLGAGRTHVHVSD